MADDGFGHVPGIEQGFILQRYGQRLHVLADAGEQRQPQQVFGQLPADIALVTEQLADQVSAGTGVVSLPGVSFRATISLSVLKTRCSLKPKNQPILPRWARPAKTLCRLTRIMHVISHFFVVLYEVSTSGRALASPAAAAGLDDFGGLRLTT